MSIADFMKISLAIWFLLAVCGFVIWATIILIFDTQYYSTDRYIAKVLIRIGIILYLSVVAIIMTALYLNGDLVK